MYRALITIIILFWSSQISFAQDTPRAEHLLQWFPTGDYREIIHQNNDMLRSANSYPDFQQFFATPNSKETTEKEQKEKNDTPLAMGDHILKRLLGIPTCIDAWHVYLPASFHSQVSSATIAQNVLINDSPERGASKTKLLDQKGNGNDKLPPSIMVTSGSDEHLGVFEVPDTEELIKEALTQGSLTSTGKKLQSKPVFTFQSGKIRSKKLTLYLVAPSTTEIIVATRINLLAAMLKTGVGLEMGMIDDHNYRDLEVIVPRLGALWQLNSFGKTRERIIDEMKASSYSLEMINKQIEKEKETPNLRINSWNLGKEIVSFTLQNYSDPEIAEKVFKNYQDNFALSIEGAPAFNLLQQKLKSRSKISLESNTIELAVTVDQELVQAMNKAAADIEKVMKRNKGSLSYKQGKSDVMVGSMVPAKKK